MPNPVSNSRKVSNGSAAGSVTAVAQTNASKEDRTNQFAIGSLKETIDRLGEELELAIKNFGVRFEAVEASNLTFRKRIVFAEQAIGNLEQPLRKEISMLSQQIANLQKAVDDRQKQLQEQYGQQAKKIEALQRTIDNPPGLTKLEKAIEDCRIQLQEQIVRWSKAQGTGYASLRKLYNEQQQKNNEQQQQIQIMQDRIGKLQAIEISTLRGTVEKIAGQLEAADPSKEKAIAQVRVEITALREDIARVFQELRVGSSKITKLRESCQEQYVWHEKKITSQEEMIAELREKIDLQQKALATSSETNAFCNKILVTQITSLFQRLQEMQMFIIQKFQMGTGGQPFFPNGMNNFVPQMGMPMGPPAASGPQAGLQQMQFFPNGMNNFGPQMGMPMGPPAAAGQPPNAQPK